VSLFSSRFFCFGSHFGECLGFWLDFLRGFGWDLEIFQVYRDRRSRGLGLLIQGEVSGRLLARVGISRGILPFFEDILSNESGNTMTFLTPPADVLGKTFQETLKVFAGETQNIPVGVKRKDGKLLINPGQITIEETDQLLIISQAILV